MAPSWFLTEDAAMCFPMPLVPRRALMITDGDYAHFAGPQVEKASSPGAAGEAGFGGVGVQAVQGQYDQLKSRGRLRRTDKTARVRE